MPVNRNCENFTDGWFAALVLTPPCCSHLIGLFVVDLVVSGLDIDQCGDTQRDGRDHGDPGTISTFHHTHKCHNTSQVI